MIDKNEIIQCVCPGGTEFINDVGCRGKVLYIVVAFIHFKNLSLNFKFIECVFVNNILYNFLAFTALIAFK